MLNEHGLISVEAAQRETLPQGAKLFVDVAGILRRVCNIILTTRGLRVEISMPTGRRRIPVVVNDKLIISYWPLAGDMTAEVLCHCRAASLPLRAWSKPAYDKAPICVSQYAG